MPIHFGTDGWRAVISDTFTFDNLRIVAQAIADAVGSEHWEANAGTAADRLPTRKGLWSASIPGFFPIVMRWKWRRVLAANGFTVLLANADAPTPAISYAVKNNCADRRRDDHRIA